MGDMADVFRAWDKQKKEKKESNRVYSTDLIKQNYTVDVKTPWHLVIEHAGKKIDFWPSTGKWNVRGQKKYNCGVRKLIKKLESM